MVWLKNLWNKIRSPYDKWKSQQALKKRLKELKEKDPFIYK